MATAAILDNPVALVVEDRPAHRIDRVNLLEARGFTVLSVENAEHALQKVHNVPALDLVITDINLDMNRPTDTSGVTLARTIRAENQTIPVVGYSAAFGEGGFGDLPPADVAVFDDYERKGQSTAQMAKRIEAWRALAVERRNKRMALAEAEVNRLLTKYQLPKPGFAKLLLMKVESALKETAFGQEEEVSAEEVLSKAGYKLRIIEPGTSRPVLSGLSSQVEEIISPLIMWVKQNNDITVAEVYGYPMLYGFGNVENEAITQVLLLMDGFRKELILDQPSEDTLLGPTRRLRDFLKHVFG